MAEVLIGLSWSQDQVVFFHPSSVQNDALFANVQAQRSTTKSGAMYAEIPLPESIRVDQIQRAFLRVCATAKVETTNQVCDVR